MKNKNSRIDLYANYSRSLAQPIALTIAVGAWLALAWWLLVYGGIPSIGAWFGRSWIPGDHARRLCLALLLTIYFLRLLLTQFVFLQRAVGWSEACMIAPWVLCIYLLLAMAGGTNPAPFGAVAGAGGLFVFGSWMNSYAEYARHVWKRRPENRGRYTRRPVPIFPAP